ncbi:MAG: transposase [Puniceicoccales bacterium]|jgi:transposase|nr:transposase [Puniceicoccales bacterium]
MITLAIFLPYHIRGSILLVNGKGKSIIKIINKKRSGAARHGRTTVIAGIRCGKIPRFTSMITRIPTIFAFGWKKFYAQNCVPDKLFMDNAEFHKSPRIRKIIENVGCQLLYLPPYSPDLNHIENYWAWLKNKLSHLWRHIANFYDRLSIALNLNYGTISI